MENLKLNPEMFIIVEKPHDRWEVYFGIHKAKVQFYLEGGWTLTYNIGTFRVQNYPYPDDTKTVEAALEEWVSDLRQLTDPDCWVYWKKRRKEVA